MRVGVRGRQSQSWVVLYEAVSLPHAGYDAALDRRAGARLPFPADLVISWFHDVRTQVRYRVLDASEDGFRIRSAFPLFEGMTGVAVKLLPEGQTINRTVMVAWLRRTGPNEHEAGLRLL
jgi:hypothetical protein